jgi:Flp pilus assembly protein TadD
MLRALAVLLALGAAPAAASSAHVDREAIEEARGGERGRFASARAISHYLEARRHAREGDAAKRVEHLRLAVTYDEESPELRVGLAAALAEKGDLTAAEGEARRALELGARGATASEAHVLLGEIAGARRQTEQAILSFRAAIRVETALAGEGEDVDADPWRLLATTYLEAGDEDAAVRTLDDLAAHRPGDGSGFRDLGRALLKRRQPGRAEQHLRRAVELAPRDLDALRLLAHAHDALGRPPEERDDLLAILRVSPDDTGALLALGRMAVRQGDVAAAQEWFHRYVRSSPDPAEAHVRVVFQWLEANHAPEALAAARAGIAEAGPDPQLRFAEGLALQDLRRWGEAADALAEVRTDSGDLFPAARLALADALSRAGRHGEAERALAAPLAAHPDDVRLVAMRASVIARAGRPRDAVALLRRDLDRRGAAAPERDVADLHVALAEILVRSGRASEAVTGLRGALAARPRNEDLLYALGSAYERAGQGEVAGAQMRALLAVNPDHAEAMNFLGYYYAEQGIRLDEAEQLVRRALELKPRSGHVLDSLGWVLFRRGEHRRAVEVLEQADALAGPDATILEHLGDAYRAARRLGDAAQAYRRALASVPDEPPLEQGKRRAAIEQKLREVTERAGTR